MLRRSCPARRLAAMIFMTILNSKYDNTDNFGPKKVINQGPTILTCIVRISPKTIFLAATKNMLGQG